MAVKNTPEDYFILHANCLMVKGYTRSTINDVYRGRYKIIPNLLHEILTALQSTPYNAVLEAYEDEKEGIEQYIGLLDSDDWGMFTPFPEKFPAIQEHWDTASTITNAVLDYDNNSTYDILNVIRQVNHLGCEAIQLRLYGKQPADFLISVYDCLARTSIQYAELLLKYDEEQVQLLSKLHEQYARIQRVQFYAAPFNKTEEIKSDVSFYATHAFVQQEIADNSCCGLVHSDFFTVNLPFYMEGLKHNNCLNRKIGVDVHGNIKNCPSSQKQFGHVDKDKLAEVISDDFRKLWVVHKDEVTDCKVCEFRRICPDCRVFVNDSTDLYSKPSKCAYNPLKGIWEN